MICERLIQSGLSSPFQISQDDGPLPPGRELNEFFKEKKQPATHFYIGAIRACRRCLSKLELTLTHMKGANVVANTVRQPFFILSVRYDSLADVPYLPLHQDIALQAREIPDQTFGVHSWTHGYSSGQTNEELLGELGWTMQGAHLAARCRTTRPDEADFAYDSIPSVLADMNGGRIPSFWVRLPSPLPLVFASACTDIIRLLTAPAFRRR